MLGGVLDAASSGRASCLCLALLGALGCGVLLAVVSLHACLLARINRHLNTPGEISDRVALHRSIEERNAQIPELGFDPGRDVPVIDQEHPAAVALDPSRIARGVEVPVEHVADMPLVNASPEPRHALLELCRETNRRQRARCPVLRDFARRTRRCRPRSGHPARVSALLRSLRRVRFRRTTTLGNQLKNLT